VQHQEQEEGHVMTSYQEMLDEYRKPEYQPEHLYFDEAAERYETSDPDFLAEAVDALGYPDLTTLPEPLLTALVAWYRTTDQYQASVQAVIEDAARP
jgi:hypothetical protein